MSGTYHPGAISRTTSTPKQIKQESVTQEADTEPQPLLGVSPVTSVSPAQTLCRSKLSESYDSGWASMSLSPGLDPASSRPNTGNLRAILKSEPGNNSSLTLQEVIEKIAGGRPSASAVTRARSSSLSDVDITRSPPGPGPVTVQWRNFGDEDGRKADRQDRRDGPSVSSSDFVTPSSHDILNSLYSWGSGYTGGQVGAASLLSDRHYPDTQLAPGDPTGLGRAAKLYRNAASLFGASCTWSGQLPPRQRQDQVYSSKIFLGGVPWDITEKCLVNAFKHFGTIKVEWPSTGRSGPVPKGYVYLIFKWEHAVAALLSQCSHHHTSSGGSWYYRISSRRVRDKVVQVIPWVLADSNFVRCPSYSLDPEKTVFVGALHGALNAEGLAHIFHDLFGGVVYAGIDTDRHKYPIGSGRVTFSNPRSYMKAVSASFIEIKTANFTKKVQVDPYLEDAVCSNCLLKQGPYFCRELSCFKYFCRYCWELHHSMECIKHHKPLMRITKMAASFGNNNKSGDGSHHYGVE